MARPNKQGVDYFPLDVHLDDKFKFIEIKYKLEGFATIIKLMQKIYSYGYWYKWTEDEALLFADEIKSDFSLVDNVVREAITRDVFSKEMFEQYGVLTSKGIQKRYKEIVRRRKDVELTEEYLLIDNNFGVNDDINPSDRQQNDVKSTQSKVKESKVNKNKESSSSKDDKQPTLIDLYHKKFVEKFGAKPLIHGGKHGKMFKELPYTYEEIERYLTMYFQDDEKFIVDGGYSIEIFISKIQKYVLKKIESKKTPVIDCFDEMEMIKKAEMARFLNAN